MPASNEPVRVDIGIGPEAAVSVPARYIETTASVMPDIEVKSLGQMAGELVATPCVEPVRTVCRSTTEHKPICIAPTFNPAVILTESFNHSLNMFNIIAAPIHKADSTPHILNGGGSRKRHFRQHQRRIYIRSDLPTPTILKLKQGIQLLPEGFCPVLSRNLRWQPDCSIASIPYLRIETRTVAALVMSEEKMDPSLAHPVSFAYSALPYTCKIVMLGIATWQHLDDPSPVGRWLPGTPIPSGRDTGNNRHRIGHYLFRSLNKASTARNGI